MNLEEYERMYRFEDTYWWFVARRHLAVSLLTDIASPTGRLTILDVGCGTGAMLDELLPFGKVIGADYSAQALSFCRRRGQRVGRHYSLARADVRSLPFADDSFDVVVAMDIIEHIDRDKDALREIYRVLRPGGCLVATVPAFMFLWSRHDEALHHYRRYTAEHFKDLVQRSGLTIHRLSYTVTLLFPLVWLFRVASNLLSFARGKRASSAHAHLVKFSPGINEWLLRVSKLENQVVRRLDLPIGVTVVSVAIKPLEQTRTNLGRSPESVAILSERAFAQ